MSEDRERNPALEALLEFLKAARGLDFTGYKRTSLERRIRRRMEAVGCGSFSDYLDHLEVQPDEFELLFNTILINVTEFFRDEAAWEYLRRVALPEMIAAKPADEPIRVWSAGCATGQEAYSIAMALAEQLGEEEFRERVKIYATDIDDEALAVARGATYGPRELESLPDELRERYFQRLDGRAAFRADLRRAVVFGRNNLVMDAPISRLDLLVCRNTLMYLTAETQARILRHFHFALRPHGVLMLGRSEMMMSHRDLFSAMDLKLRIFRRHPGATDRDVRAAAKLASGLPDGRLLPDEERQLRMTALDLGPAAQLIVSRSGALTYANVAARALFDIGEGSLGQPFGELRVAREPVDLVAAYEQVVRTRRRIALGEVAFRPGQGELRQLEVSVLPLMNGTSNAVGVSVVFEDVGATAVLRQELADSRRALEVAYEELESTVDELETTNEELQSANEELQTTNEELQSTNEELETMNEELQSTNEELETINDELRDRTSELNRVNDFLETILSSLGLAVTVVDRTQRVLVWNGRAEDLWGLRAEETVDRFLLALDVEMPVDAIAPVLRAVLNGSSGREQLALEAVNRRGRPILCETTILPLPSGRADDAEIRGAIILMEDRPRGDGNGRGPAA
jgi:two-component system CheB/CheR fusion protein